MELDPDPMQVYWYLHDASKALTVLLPHLPFNVQNTVLQALEKLNAHQQDLAAKIRAQETMRRLPDNRPAWPVAPRIRWRSKMMMTREYTPTTGWAVPPECAGQIVEESYALDAEAGVILVCREDQSFPSGHPERETITAYAYPEDDDDETWDPWNGAPTLGIEIGPAQIRGTRC